MVFATGMVGLLMKRSASEFRGPHNQRAVEHSALLQIGQQSCDGLIDSFRQSLVIFHRSVRIPILPAVGTGIDQFQKTHAAFRQPSGHKALPAES